MSVAQQSSPGLQSAAPFDLYLPGTGSASAYEALGSSLLDVHSLQGGLGGLDSALRPGVAAAASNLGGAFSTLDGLLGAPSVSQHDALAQLAALQQQQQLAAALDAQQQPLLSLSNLLAAHQGLNLRVHELLLLKQLAAGNPPQRSHGGGIRGTGPLANPLYKTELCRSWEETGSCRYGAKCQFAHGREELRPVMRHPKYKTEICRTFAQSGTCPYGTRCRFIHTTSAPSLTALAYSAGARPTSAISAGGRTCTATPNTGASTPPTPSPSRDTSFASLSGLAAAAATSPLPTHTTAMSPTLASLAASLSAGSFECAASAATSTASLLGLQSGCAAAYSPYGVPTPGAAPPAAFSPLGPATAGADAHTLAALAALLGSAGGAAPPPPASPPVRTAAAALASSSPFLGVVGPPAGLAPIGTVGCQAGGWSASPPLAQARGPSCPATPLGSACTGVPAAMRRSISDSDGGTPNSAAKRLPIFEQLIPEPAGQAGGCSNTGGTDAPAAAPSPVAPAAV